VESFEAKLQRVLAERVEIVPYNPAWPAWFAEEAAHLRACLPGELLGRIEHFGSTAVPGLAAKPIIDMLVETRCVAAVQERVVPILEAQGYDYFWRPTWGDDVPPFYAWFIRRDAAGRRTHHLHFVEPGFPHWERLRFRDYLTAHPEAARQYEALKRRLAEANAADRVAYTEAKTAFIQGVTARAKSERTCS
jgi:GrpB-like predicted nucleotidyltransferase (UPF0157 family)